MRSIVLLPLLLTAAACNVDNDSNNDSVTLEYNQQQIEEGASRVENAADELGSSIANIASSTGQAISNEVGDIDVDVDVRRNSGDGNTATTNGQ